jgi:hypothetical protein
VDGIKRLEMVYSEYEQFIETILQNDDFANFKSNLKYNDILEHVSFDYGQQYLQLIKRLFSIPIVHITLFGRMNDSVGEPHKEYYKEDNLHISPTSLRYVFHALLILNDIAAKGIRNAHIVEVGCGYGGLALAISHLSPLFNLTIDDYTFIDLPGPLKLQEKYMNTFRVPMKLAFHPASTFGSELQGSDYFLISNYCFSEISKEFQDNYVRTLFPKCKHGFITWNHIDVYDIGKQIEVQDEFPLTGSKNKYVRF